MPYDLVHGFIVYQRKIRSPPATIADSLLGLVSQTLNPHHLKAKTQTALVACLASAPVRTRHCALLLPALLVKGNRESPATERLAIERCHRILRSRL